MKEWMAYAYKILVSKIDEMWSLLRSIGRWEDDDDDDDDNNNNNNNNNMDYTEIKDVD